MKKITLLSVVAATVLFTACGDEVKKAASDAASSAKQMVKDTASNAVEATKNAASEVASSAKDKVVEAADSAKVEAERLAATAVEKAKETTENAVEATKNAAGKAMDSAKEVMVATEIPPASTTESPKEEVATKKSPAGKAAFAKCAACHGVDGTTKALGKSEVIAGQSATDIENKLKEYKAGTRNVAGMGMLMKGQVSPMSDEDIKAVATYISEL